MTGRARGPGARAEPPSPPPQPAWTVGQLRAATEGLPDDTPLLINAEDFADPAFRTEQVVTDGGLDAWHDEHGDLAGVVLTLTCEVPDGEIELRRGEPARALAPGGPWAFREPPRQAQPPEPEFPEPELPEPELEAEA